MARFQRPLSAHLRNGIAVCRDLRKFKEAKKQFDKVSEEKEAALSKNAQAPRNKQHEVEEATNTLKATRKCFRHLVLDYVLQVRARNPLRRDSGLTFVVKQPLYRFLGCCIIVTRRMLMI